MSEGGEKMCPLCAEEMDLTDQHLKPCKCGYEICVWCWHQIMDMAEKDETEGRCPACRIPYNKEKIVAMTEKRERLASEIYVEKKLKSQKGKSKTSEARKQLSSVRVIQKNLVYVVGLPLTFADEDLLMRRDTFNQYGKVMKVSISRTAAGAIQQFPNNSCSVYITYSKEEEAVRCIQSVNGFVLDGRPLKACFGTTKYCHAWLRNMACSNTDCLYLHETGPQEDSFCKDEIISAYTRNRVQQITGAPNSMQRYSGNVLPPPADEYCNNTSAPSAKLITKTATNTNTSPPNSSSGRSAALPPGASWGARTFNNHPSSTSTPHSNGSLKADTSTNPVPFSSEVASRDQVSSLQANTGKKLVPNEASTISQDKIQPVKREPNHDSRNIISESSYASIRTKTPPPHSSNIADSSIKCSGPDVDNNSIENICSDMSTMGIYGYDEQITEPHNQSDFSSDIPTQLTLVDKTEDELLSFDKQRLMDPELDANRNRISDFFNSFHLKKESIVHSQFNNGESSTGAGFNRQDVDTKDNSRVNHLEYYSNFSPRTDKTSPSNVGVNIGENSIISNILSMDFDSFDESLTSPQNLAKFMGENDKQKGSFGPPGSWKTQNSNQSRFSFAREEEPMRQVSNFGPSDYFEEVCKQRPFGNDLSNSNSLNLDKYVGSNGFPIFGGTDSDIFASSHSHNKLSVSRSQVSAPPGFSVPSRIPPPGFASYERTGQSTFSGNNMLETSSFSRNQFQIPPSSSNTINNVDIEFFDPAIVAFIKGTHPGGAHSPGPDLRSSFSPQMNRFEEARTQSYLPKSQQLNPNQRFNDLRDNFTSNGDSYGLHSRVMENSFSPFSPFSHPQSRNSVPPSNGQWNQWSEFPNGNDLAMAELLRNERLGYNKFYNGYEDSNIRTPNSSNIYNGTYGI